MRLIDADALYIDHLYPTTTTGTTCWGYVSQIQINNAPTIEAVPERNGYDTGTSRWFHCSECGYGVFDVYLDDEQKYDLAYHYCPNCGAKMKGV